MMNKEEKGVYILDLRKVRQQMRKDCPADAALVFLIHDSVWSALERGVLDDVVVESGDFPVELRVGPRNERGYWEQVSKIARGFGFSGWMVGDDFFDEFERYPSASPSVIIERVDRYGVLI
jgi:hypothetical protein